MLTVESIICIFLLSCFDKQLSHDQLNDCPSDCQCFGAPKEGIDWSNKSVSVICDIDGKLDDKRFHHLAKFSSVNTLALGVVGDITFDDLHFGRRNVLLTHLYVQDTRSIGRRNALKRLPNLNINGLTLKYLTMIGLNLLEFRLNQVSWSGLRGVHIQDCQLKSLNQNNLGPLNKFPTLRTFTILSGIESPLEKIDNQVFNDCTNLRMLTIKKGRLTTMDWLRNNLHQLWYVDLSDNLIETLPEDIFSEQYMPKLRELNLDNNNFKILHWNQLMPGLKKMSTFSINENVLCFDETAVDLYQQFHKYSDRMPKFFGESLAKKNCEIMPNNETLLNDPKFLNDNSKNCRHLVNVELLKPVNIKLCSKWKGSKLSAQI